MNTLMYRQMQYLQPTSLSKEGISLLFGLSSTQIDKVFHDGCQDNLTGFKTKAARRARLLRNGNMQLARIVGFVNVKPDSLPVLHKHIDARITGVGPVMALYDDGTGLLFDVAFGRSKVNLFVGKLTVDKLANGCADKIPTRYAMVVMGPCKRFHFEPVEDLLLTKPSVSVLNGMYLADFKDQLHLTEAIRRTYMIHFPADAVRVVSKTQNRLEIEGINGYTGRATLTVTGHAPRTL